MESYEHIARKADADGSYDNPYDVEPVELTPYWEKRMKLIKNFYIVDLDIYFKCGHL